MKYRIEQALEVENVFPCAARPWAVGKRATGSDAPAGSDLSGSRCKSASSFL